MNNPVPKRGFTLVELLVVIAIIAILSVIGVTVFSGVQSNTRDAKRRGDLKAITLALEQYKMDTGAYPYTNAWVCSSAGTNWIPGLNSYFTSGEIPQSPSKNERDFYNTPHADHLAYCYFTSTDYGGAPAGKWFMLVVPLEKPTASDLATKCTAGGVDFNYGAIFGQNTVMACNQQ